MGCKKELTSVQRGTIFTCTNVENPAEGLLRLLGVGASQFQTPWSGTLQLDRRSCDLILGDHNQSAAAAQAVSDKQAQNRRLCTAEVQKLWKKKSGKDSSVHTVGRTLCSTGLWNCVVRKKPLVSTANQAKRRDGFLDEVGFAHTYLACPELRFKPNREPLGSHKKTEFVTGETNLQAFPNSKEGMEGHSEECDQEFCGQHASPHSSDYCCTRRSDQILMC